MTSISDLRATAAQSPDATWGIGDIAEATGLSKDTLRWYEREGLIPLTERSSNGYRTYDDATLRILQLIVRLRRTGMPVADIRAFAHMVEEGAASHGRRTTLLHQHRRRVLDQMAQLQDDLAAIDNKIEHYDRLIGAGLDCGDQPIHDQAVRAAQQETL